MCVFVGGRGFDPKRKREMKGRGSVCGCMELELTINETFHVIFF